MKILGLLLLYLALPFVCFLPVSLHPGSRMPAYPEMYISDSEKAVSRFEGKNWDMDAGIAMWVYQWHYHELFRNPVRLFHANIYHPYPYTLALADNFLGVALIGLPVQLVSGNPVLAYNLIFYLACALNGLFTFCFFRCCLKNLYPDTNTEDRVKSRLAAVTAGALMTVLPYHYAHTATMHRMVWFGFPLSLLFLEKYFESYRTRHAIGLAAVIVYQLSSTWYLSICLAALIAMYLIFQLLVPRIEFWRWKLLADSGWLLLIVVPAFLVMAWPYVRLHELVPEFQKPESFQVMNSIRPSEYLSTYRQIWLYGFLGMDFLPVRLAKKAYFPGFTIFLLGAAGLWYALTGVKTYWKRNPMPLFITSAGMISFILSLGPYLRYHGRRIPMPYWLLYQYFPGFKAIKPAPGFAAVVLFCWIVLSAIGFHRILRRFNPRNARILAASVITLAAVESLHPGMDWMEIPGRSQIPEAWQWVAGWDGKGAVASIFARPVPGIGRAGNQNAGISYRFVRHLPMYFSIHSGFHPILEGTTSYIPPASMEYNRLIRGFPSDECLDLMRAMGADLLVVVADSTDDTFVTAVEADLDARLGIRPAGRFTDSLIFDLTEGKPVDREPEFSGVIRWSEPEVGSGITLELFNDFATIVTLYPKDLVRKASVRIGSGEGESPPEFQIDLRLPYIWMKGDTLRLDAEIPEKLRGKAHVPPGETREVQVRFEK